MEIDVKMDYLVKGMQKLLRNSENGHNESKMITNSTKPKHSVQFPLVTLEDVTQLEENMLTRPPDQAFLKKIVNI